jgi:hypothetical protein
MITKYVETGLYEVVINTTLGNVNVGGETFIEDDPKKARIFQVAYLMGREHKKKQISKALGQGAFV